MSLIHPDDARAQLLSSVKQLSHEEIYFADAAGRTTAKQVVARLTQPPFPASAMDGWAVRYNDLPGPFAITGQSAAGHPFQGELSKGQTVRIFTGAVMPAGADTVIVQEEVSATADSATLIGEGPPHIGAHVRAAGQDFSQDQPLIPAGTRLTARHLGLLAASGNNRVSVHARPRVTLIATGDELVPAGHRPGAGQIVNAAGPMLSALLTAAGADVSDLGILPDQRDQIAAALTKAKADLIITVGGASVGDHDLIIPVLNDLGATLDFWKIAMRPGKPLIAGHLGNTHILGLPGNPVSAYVCALLFAWPLIHAIAGLATTLPIIHAQLSAPLPANGNRRDHLRATRQPDGSLQPAPTQDSAQLALLAMADVLILREAFAPAAQSGDIVAAIPLDMFSYVA